MFLIPLLRVYIKQHSSNAYSVHPCTAMYPDLYWNKFFKCTYVHLCLFYLRVILQGFVDPIMQQYVQLVTTESIVI